MSRVAWMTNDRRRRSTVAAGLLLLCGALTLSACGGSSSAAAPKMLPALQKAQAALKDATGAFTFASPSKTFKLAGTGTCQMTVNPQRSVEVTKVDNQSAMTIVDGLTTTYSQLPAAASQGGSQAKWLKSTSITSIVQDVSDVLDYAGYTKAIQQADTTLNGVAVIHVYGVEVSGNNVDLYLRKDTYLPVKAVIQHTDTSGVDITVTFSKTNTGATIALPPANEVLAQ